MPEIEIVFESPVLTVCSVNLHAGRWPGNQETLFRQKQIHSFDLDFKPLFCCIKLPEAEPEYQLPHPS